ncbi:hypothetical protein [Marinomonas atlantica]|uniref:hypothetical protein n=1 Tax=Marinomonas atlantica TaxID=1806668 RepID=UPI00082D8C63|nr:hypothetical protein [Marinomonas atlantica]
MKLPRPLGFSLLTNSRCGSGTTDPHLRSALICDESALFAPSGAFLATQKVMDWDDLELCKLVDQINERFGQLRHIDRQDADQM